MSGSELNNLFDILFNNISSDKAPGLNTYEKSVLLTKAQNELLLNCFNAVSKGNTVGAGFDDTAIRQSDFSNLLKTAHAEPSGTSAHMDPRAYVFTRPKDAFITINEQVFLSNQRAEAQTIHLGYYEWFEADDSESPELIRYWQKMPDIDDYKGCPKVTDLSSVKNPQYGDIYELVSYTLLPARNSDIRQVIPVSYVEYQRLMSKPFKEPLKWQAWRLTVNTDDDTDVEIVMPSADEKYRYRVYSLRYVKKPKPIILEPLGYYSIDGYNGTEDIYNVDADHIITNPCELSDILQERVVQRAVEIAKATWMGDPNALQAIQQSGQRSE